ncbi:hypothetical protein N7508_010581 [Penicillium antarcticum]|uniref:uncharacterized protein n=1 Tax=Penicillium antarcticum TaxID=416450 RepID=UPI002395ED1B|nr:uncharacterized protein N7508_010581 [Penicillium antarcticum]KAJ5295760.1 hypothetical protein N7508_010581 [Penicillium antarcticum]
MADALTGFIGAFAHQISEIKRKIKDIIWPPEAAGSQEEESDAYNLILTPSGGHAAYPSKAQSLFFRYPRAKTLEVLVVILVDLTERFVVREIC